MINFCGLRRARYGFLVFAVLLSTVAGHVAKAGERKNVQIGKKTVELVVPAGFCLMNEAHPSDISFLNAVRGVFANSHQLLGAFADCTEQKNWRTGKRPYLDSFGQYITPLAGLRQDITLARADMVAALCKQMDKLSGAVKKKISGSVKKRMEAQIEGAKFENINLLKGAFSDGNACYFSSRQNVTTPTGTTKIIAGVSAMTLIKGKIVQLNLYDRFKDDKTVLAMFRQQQKNVADLLASNSLK